MRKTQTMGVFKLLPPLLRDGTDSCYGQPNFVHECVWSYLEVVDVILRVQVDAHGLLLD